MTNQPKPCLAGCGMSERWPTRMFHDLGCPNAEAAKALTPPEWEEANHEQDAPCPMCGAPDGMRLRAGHGYESCDCIKCGGTLGNYSEGMLIDLIVREWFQSLKPAPAPAPEPQGEPSIDFEAANFYVEHLEAGGTCNECPPHMENLGRAYLHLAAEVAQEKLFRRADIEQRDKFRAALDSKDAECVALAAEVERLKQSVALYQDMIATGDCCPEGSRCRD